MKHKKFKKSTKIISVILSLLLIVGTIVAVAVFNTASAETFTDDNGISWTVTESYPGWAIAPSNKSQMVGTIEIPSTYKGKVILGISTSAFSSCNQLQSVVIPDSIMSIGDNAFEQCSNLTSINIPNSVTDICHWAFQGCTKLDNITLSNNITLVGDYSFADCNNLKNITIPDSVTKIDNGAFVNCTSLQDIILPDNLKTIGESSFGNCALNSVSIPNTVESIGEYAFSENKSLYEITIPDSVTNIGRRAFYSCSALLSITIPESVEILGEETFTNCSNLSTANVASKAVNGFTNCSSLRTVILQNTCKYISPSAFINCTGLTSVTIPGSVKTIDSYAFDGCTSLNSVDFNSGLEYICERSFANTNITSVELPNTLKSIGSQAFIDTKLESITIPESVKSIGYMSFNDWNEMPSLNTVNITGSQDWIDSTSFPSRFNIEAISNIYPDDNDVYRIPERGMSFTDNDIVWDVTPNSDGWTISFSRAERTSALYNIEIPSEYLGKPITEIEDIKGVYSRYGSTPLNISIPNSIKRIRGNAFANMQISAITLPNSIIEIGGGAFLDCKELSSINIPDSVTNIGNYAFSGCTKLNEVTIPESTKNIGEHAFSKCKNLKNIQIPANISSVGAYAFSDIGEIDTLTINANRLSAISGLSFYNDHINDFIIGENVKKIDTPLLSGDTGFTSVTLSPDVEITNPYAFYGDENLTVRTYKKARSVREYTTANSIPTVLLDSIESKKVNFELTCDKQGYEFEVFKVADIQDNSDWYEIRYNSLIPSITDEIFDGNSAEMLKELDKVAYNNLGTPVGSYKTNDDGASKQFNNLDPGIYYVRATNFPANVKWVQNSVFALPYYDKTNGWVYEIDPIPLATKTDESEPEIKKTISNSTRDEDKGRFTDVSLGDTVNFTIKSSTVGSVNTVDSLDFKLKKYEIKDTMSEGLTLNSDSFVVTIEDINGDTTGTLTRDRDYTVNIKTVGTDTVITISLAANYLNNSTDFYSAYNVVTSYTADLNEKAVRGVVGNPNEATSLTWQNKNEVESTVDGNEVYAYTFGIEVNKYNDAGTPLAGSTFALYRTEDDAENQRNAIATGTSTSTGKVEFKTNNNVIRLESGTYYIVETESTQDYNRYTDVITAPLRVEYTDVKTNGTYVLSAPENGILQIDVKNSKVIIPNTGGDGAMYRYIIGGIFLLLAAAFIIMKVKSNKKAKAASK